MSSVLVFLTASSTAVFAAAAEGVRGKDNAPGQVKQPGESAKNYAPGQVKKQPPECEEGQDPEIDDCVET